jgi:hypothetical protein
MAPVAAVAVAVFGFPHTVFHALHMAHVPAFDAVCRPSATWWAAHWSW